MQQPRAIPVVAQVAFIGVLTAAVVITEEWAADRVPLWISGPVLIAIIIGIAWRETRA